MVSRLFALYRTVFLFELCHRLGGQKNSWMMRLVGLWFVLHAAWRLMTWSVWDLSHWMGDPGGDGEHPHSGCLLGGGQARGMGPGRTSWDTKKQVLPSGKEECLAEPQALVAARAVSATGLMIRAQPADRWKKSASSTHVKPYLDSGSSFVCLSTENIHKPEGVQQRPPGWPGLEQLMLGERLWEQRWQWGDPTAAF